MLSGLSYNIYLGKNLPQILNWLNHFPKSLDIICLQEFPQSRTFLFKDKSEYAVHFAASFKKRGEVYGELTLIRKKKVKILTAQTVDLGKSIFEQRIFRSTGTRSSLVTQLSYNDTTFILANTHLAAIASNIHRLKQLRKLIDFLESKKLAKHTPMIILGDLNYSSLLGRRSLLAFMQTQEYTSAYFENTHKFLKTKDHQLDYIFYKNMQVGNINVLKLPFSDHFPITFTLHVNN